MALRPVSVTQLNEYISRVLQTDPLLGNISVTGEISNLKYHSTGHVYFSLVDEGSKINCFLPSSYAAKLQWQLGDGMEIVVQGYVNVFKKGGTYTLFVRSIQVSGEGNLAQAFQILKDKLNREGLFDTAHKKQIPTYPKKLGIVTSETGAAAYDILKIIKSRTKLVDVEIFPVLVQGDAAAGDIAGMIDYINQTRDDIDVLIVGRGGGSMEDLWAFNEEIVARAIYNSRIPIISAVGHEIDFTIADFVADRRAETPTAAAEMAVPEDAKLREKIEMYRDGLLLNLKNKVSYDKLSVQQQRQTMEILLRKRLDEEKHRLEKARLILEENSPVKILEKGYSVLETMDGHTVTSVAQLKKDGRFVVRMRDGVAQFTIGEIWKDGDEDDL